jgi:hypothetical protein
VSVPEADIKCGSPGIPSDFISKATLAGKNLPLQKC